MKHLTFRLGHIQRASELHEYPRDLIRNTDNVVVGKVDTDAGHSEIGDMTVNDVLEMFPDVYLAQLLPDGDVT